MLLVIHRSPSAGNTIAQIFFRMGILSTAKRPMPALNEISFTYSAVLIVDPEHLPDETNYISKLRACITGIPFYALTGSPEHAEQTGLYQQVFPSGIYAPQIATKMIQSALTLQVRPIGDYRLAGINADPRRGKVTYFGRLLPLTRTESMVVRFLIRTYPFPQKSARLLKYLFTPDKTPSPSDVRTHVCAINRKFRELACRKLICSSDNGYCLMTCEKNAAVI